MPYALCPMPYALCPMPYAHEYLIFLRKAIVVENLAVTNLIKNSQLAKSITDAGWGQFCTMLKYKSEWEGRVYIEIDRFFPSSKTGVAHLWYDTGR